MITDVLHDVFQGQPGLGGGRDDLIGWQDETIATGVPQLEGKGVLDAEVVGPVDAAAAGLIWEEEGEEEEEKQEEDASQSDRRDFLTIQLVFSQY